MRKSNFIQHDYGEGRCKSSKTDEVHQWRLLTNNYQGASYWIKKQENSQYSRGHITISCSPCFINKLSQVSPCSCRLDLAESQTFGSFFHHFIMCIFIILPVLDIRLKGCRDIFLHNYESPSLSF